MIHDAHERALRHRMDEVSKTVVPSLTQIGATVMFTDIEDSTGLARALGVTGIAKFLRRHCDLVEARVQAYHGIFLGCTGDGVLAFWSDEPLRHSNPARLALLAAADLGRHITEENIGRQAAGLPTRRVRMGLHSGEVGLEQACRSGALPKLYGATAHEARRIEQAGKNVAAVGEEVVVMASEATLRLAALGPEVVRRTVRPQAYGGCAPARCGEFSAVEVDPTLLIASLAD